MALLFSSLKQRSRCLTGWESGQIFRECLVTSLGMPDMSEGFQAKISLLARRKSTSALSYLAESVALTRTFFAGSEGSRMMSFVSSVDLKVLDLALEVYRTSEAATFPRSASSLNAASVAARSQLARSH